LETKELFNTAIGLYRNKSFEQAMTTFTKINELNPHDKAVLIYLERCKKNLEHGIPEDWDGVEVLRFK